MAGYRIIDLTDHPFTTETLTTGVTVPGIFEKVEGSRRVLLVDGLTVDQIEKKPFYVRATVSGSDFILKGSGISITVAADDKVTVTME